MSGTVALGEYGHAEWSAPGRSRGFRVRPREQTSVRLHRLHMPGSTELARYGSEFCRVAGHCDLIRALAAWCQQTAPSPALPAALEPVFSEPDQTSDYGLVYVPLDSWIYPAFERLFSLGYADSAYLGMRPWTRTSCLQILQETYPKLQDAPQDEEAWKIFQALAVEFGANAGQATPRAELADVYTREMYIKGRPINDSYHFGQTLINDYGRPYQQGFNALDGFTARAEGYHLSLDVRGEYQHAPGRAAYPESVQELIAQVDSTPLLGAGARAADQRLSLDQCQFGGRRGQP